MVTTGFGLIIKVNVCAAPTQPFKVGVTVIIEICCVVTVAAVNEAILPVPLAAKPVAVLLFVQLNVAPEGKLLKFIAETVAPEQMD